MKRMMVAVVVLAAFLGQAEEPAKPAAGKPPIKVSILGDSYSTFDGKNPPNQAPWYPNPTCGVTEVDQTWWMQVITRLGATLLVNDAWGGSTISTTGYDGADYTARAFFTRATRLGEDPDLILICGGTNDDWAGAPLGKDKWKDWTEEDLKSLRPALAKTLATVQEKYPKAKILFVVNGVLRKEVKGALRAVCSHYKVKSVEARNLEDKLKMNHPTPDGMKVIANAVMNTLKSMGFKEIKQKPAPKAAKKDTKKEKE